MALRAEMMGADDSSLLVGAELSEINIYTQ